MAKFTEAEKKRKVEHARQLYCKGFDFDVIADILEDVSASTVQRWAIDNDFEKSKRSQIIALSEIRNSILTSYADLLDGKKPKVKPDEAAKYATAFEKFSARKQVLSYMYEAFELLTEEYMLEIQQSPKQEDKQFLLDNLRMVRKYMDRVITKLTNEVLGNE